MSRNVAVIGAGASGIAAAIVAARCGASVSLFEHTDSIGNKIMIVSLIGIMFFSMTAAVTLGMVISVMKIAPGAAFGVTTVAIFFGTLAAFFVRSDSLIFNISMIVITSAICFLLAMYILKPDKEVCEK